MNFLRYWFGEEVGEGETKIHYTPTPPDASEDPPLEINPVSNDVQTMSKRGLDDVQTTFERDSDDVPTLFGRKKNESQTANASLKKKFNSYKEGDKAMSELEDFAELRDQLLKKGFVEQLTGGLKLETLEVTKNKEVSEYCGKLGIPEAQAARLVLETRIYKEHKNGMLFFKWFVGVTGLLILTWIVAPKLYGEHSENVTEVQTTTDTITNTREFAELWAKKRGVVFTTTRLDLLEKELRGLSPTSANEHCLKQFKIQNEKWFQKDITE